MSLRVHERIEADVDRLTRTFKIKVSSAIRTPEENRAVGGATDSDHLTGLGVDFIPDFARGGTWDDVDRAAAYARSRPEVFRWIGYDGVEGHGRGDHLHLSWKPDTSLLGKVKRALGEGPGGGLLGLGGIDKFNDVDDAAKAAANFAKDPVGAIVDAIAGKGAKPLLTIALVLGGAAIAAIGVARLVGFRAPNLAAALATRNPRAGGAA